MRFWKEKFLCKYKCKNLLLSTTE